MSSHRRNVGPGDFGISLFRHRGITSLSKMRRVSRAVLFFDAYRTKKSSTTVGMANFSARSLREIGSAYLLAGSIPARHFFRTSLAFSRASLSSIATCIPNGIAYPGFRDARSEHVAPSARGVTREQLRMIVSLNLQLRPETAEASFPPTPL